ncbi:hypothetical protein FISHEDRAFT_57158 [Fistulina hepatica ATCC 64428]|nr:hypothetical protein FISHEDRAFT_57158 [Fistulina hepatica ATCC 64428]
MFNPYMKPYDSSDYSPYYYDDPYRGQRCALSSPQARKELATRRALEERQRARRSQYFPDGYYDGYELDDPFGYPSFDRELAYREEEMARQQQVRQNEEARLRALADQRRREYDEVQKQRRREVHVSSSSLSPEPVHRIRVTSPAREVPACTVQSPIDIPVSSSLAPEKLSVPTPPASPTPSMKEREAAAEKIQAAYRHHHALTRIAAIQSRFRDLKSGFQWPDHIDYYGTDGAEVTSVPLPSSSIEAFSSQPSDDEQPSSPARLAYTHSNVSLHGYVESLNRLLVELDGVDSYGRKDVREKRKAVVREVENECSFIDRVWRGLWNSRSDL